MLVYVTGGLEGGRVVRSNYEVKRFIRRIRL